MKSPYETGAPMHPHETHGQPFVKALPSQEDQKPLIVTAPHPGIFTPPELKQRLALPLFNLLARGDRYTDWISMDAPDHGAALIYSAVAASFLNVGRRHDSIHPDDVRGEIGDLEVDPESIYVNKRQGQGLVALRDLYQNLPLYKPGEEPDAAEIKSRLDEFYFPFHTAVAQQVEDHLERFGFSFLFDEHSCPAIGAPKDVDHGLKRADVILGDAYGGSCHPKFTRKAAEIAQDHGYRVEICGEPGGKTNYAGGFNTRQYGRTGPFADRGAQALQIEWSRGVETLGFKDDKTSFEIENHAAFDKAQRVNHEIISELSDLAYQEI